MKVEKESNEETNKTNSEKRLDYTNKRIKKIKKSAKR